MNFVWTPTLEGETIRLRPLVEADRDALYAVAADPDIWAMHPAHDRHLRPVFEAFLDLAFADQGGLIVEDRETGRMLGFSRYPASRTAPGEVEIGWTFLARDMWGKGINAEMKLLMIDHAFCFVNRLIFLIGENNLRSRRAVEKLGATLEEQVIEGMAAGQPVRHLIYALQREKRG